ncbi:glycosyltransferase [Cyclobacterium jeungdonense]|uniref:Glycosyltransferase n=1 Tax=Cyclobacterium jeungdonense TaxID=708087 RepID=A0ABT8CDT5_9BACT|nr:glycosyltransferase [Cyclobacterium jeungdonense]MDN3690576.1 glycosyltransferase [Cyclobacterium jeungdonense]
MKILRVVSELDFGGVEQVLAISVPYLVHSKRIEVLIVVLGKGGRVSERMIQNGFSVIVLNQATKIPNIKLVFQLKNLIRNEKPDVVHCQGSEANFHGLWAATMADVKIKIGEEIGLPDHHSYWKWVFKWIYRKANRVIGISEAVKNCIVELREVKGDKVSVLYNPVSIDEKRVDFSRIPYFRKDKGNCTVDMSGKQKNNNSFVYVTTCRLVPIKNLERLIKAFSILLKVHNNKNMELWIVGDGPSKESLMQLVKQFGIQDSVKFSGFQENVFQFLAHADVFVLPSLREGSSVALAEAMSNGLPSIVTQIGGAREVLGESHSGFLVDPFSTDSILSAMLNMFELSEEERKEMGKMAKKASQRFSIETYIEDLLEVYKG